MYIELLSYIRPVLEYADVIWNNCTQYESNELEKNQNEAARIVTGTTKLVSNNSLLSETGWETLSSRRNKHKLTLLYKIQMIFPLNTFVHLYRQPWEVPHPLRNADDLHILHTNSQLYYNSFLPSAVREWNELPIETRYSSSLDIFKTRINNNISLPPSYYFTGKRLGQIYHARLELNVAPCVITCFR